jgi:CubicO group peptidase (beta-lactamase class C family)
MPTFIRSSALAVTLVLNVFLMPIVATASEALGVDTPMTTVAGNTFTAPADWTVSVKGPATILSPPEDESALVLVDVKAEDADAAVAAGWAAYREHGWALRESNEQADNDGWSKRKRFDYQTSPNEKRDVIAGAWFANDAWTVWIYDMSQAVGGKRGAAVSLVLGSLRPKGYERESFAGKKAHQLDQARLAELTGFIERGLEASGVPGTSLAVIQDGKLIFSGGFGLRELGKPEKADGDTLYMVASNSKGLSTLLLAKLVDEGKLNWSDPVTRVMPGFKLGDMNTTAQVKVEHLVCACTGLPRQDMEWILEFGAYTPESSMELLGTMQPTSDFGDLFQYSNVLAAAGGYVGAYVAYPEIPLGVAYDRAMQDRVFDPLGMTSTTFDYAKALGSGNVASPHSVDVNGKPAVALMDVNYAAVPVRPAGAAWSSVNDMIKYVAMELAGGLLPDGERYISQEPLFERRERKVDVGEDHVYGMGLMVDSGFGTPVVHHGGDMIGFHSDMMWLPEHNVGAVVLTNGDPGWLIRSGFRRKLLEVLFDGKPEADAALAANSKNFLSNMAVEYELLAVPADAEISSKLAASYHNAALGGIRVSRDNGVTSFDFGEWKSEVGSRVNPDGTVSFMTTAPGITGLEFVVVEGETKQLSMSDAQHEYIFVADE